MSGREGVREQSPGAGWGRDKQARPCRDWGEAGWAPFKEEDLSGC